MRILSHGLLAIVLLLTISVEAMAKNSENSLAICYSRTFTTMSREQVQSVIHGEKYVELSSIDLGTYGQVSGLSITVSAQSILYKSSDISDSEMDLLKGRLKKALKKVRYGSDDRDINFLGCLVEKSL